MRHEVDRMHELRERRLALGLYQRDVARRMGTARVTVTKAEGGVFAPSDKWMARYERALDELLEEMRAKLDALAGEVT